MIIVKLQSYHLTFKFDDFIANLANINISVIIQMIQAGEFVELRLVIGLMVVRLNGFARTTKLLSTKKETNFKTSAQMEDE